MRQISLVVATLATLTFAATLSTAHADNYWGPKKVGDLCWKKQLGNSLGYWEQCKDAKTARASTRRGRR